jgi:GxxExxY protein
MELLNADVTEQIIGAAFEVYRVLGYGFLERVYQRAMQVELQTRGFKAEIEAEIRVVYKRVEVGFYKADVFVNDCVLVELKVAKSYNSDDEPQLLNEIESNRRESGPSYQLRPHESRIQTLCFLGTDETRIKHG